MSVTSRLSFSRSAAQQPAANLYGPMGASALGAGGSSGSPAPSSASMASGAQPAGGGATFLQIVLGLAIVWAIWWAITLILERLLPLKDTPSFVREWLHGFKIALLVGGWFIVWKMTAGVAPFNQIEPYQTIAASV